MKTIACLFALLLLSAPAWADDKAKACWKEADEYHNQEGHNEIRCMSKVRLCRELESAKAPYLLDRPPAIDYDATFPKRYEYKIVPEAELDAWLNQGWECVKVYTIMKDIHKVGTVRGEYPPEGMPVNKAIIRRVKP